MPARPAVLAVVLPLLVFSASDVSAVRRRAFVTSVQGTGDLFSWAGSSGTTALDRADSICRARAAAGSLPNAATYRAWLSTSSTDAFCHVQGLSGKRTGSCNGAIQPGGGPWYQVNGGTQFTADLATLTGPDHVIYRPVLFDEFVTTVVPIEEGHLWTGTDANGVGVSGGTCQDWVSGSSGASGVIGLALGGSYAWTYFFGSGCNELARLLCLEPGASETTPLAWQPGSLVFVTSAMGPGELESWPQAGGLTGWEAADAICRSAAASASLPAPESFVAWLSDGSSTAADRLTSDGPFRRLDGFSVASSRAALLGGTVLNSIHVDENYVYIQRLGWTWTGTGAGGLTTGDDCAYWSSSHPAVLATVGFANVSRAEEWTGLGAGHCDELNSLYCFSNAITLFWDGFEYTEDTSRWSATAP